MKKYLFLFLFVAVFLQFDFFFMKSKFEIFQNSDESWYGIVLNRLETSNCNQSGVPITFLYTNRPHLYSCHFLETLNTISPFRETYSKTLYLKILARILTLALFLGFSILLLGKSEGFIPGLLLGTWYFLDPGIHEFKPSLLLIDRLMRGEYDAFSHTSRFVSPLHYFIPGLLALLGILFLIRRKEKKGSMLPVVSELNQPINFSHSLRIEIKNDICLIRKQGLFSLAFLTVGFFAYFVSLYWLSLTPFYTWLPFLFLFSCVFLYSLYFQTILVNIKIAFSLLFLAICIVYQLKATLLFPFKEEVLLRSGFFSHYFSPVFAFHKGLIFFSLLLSWVSYFIFKRRIFPALWVGVGLYGLVNANLLTGLEYQNFHFKDYLGPMAWASMLLYVYSTKKSWRTALNVLCLFVVLMGAGFRYISLTRATSLDWTGIQSLKDTSNIFAIFQGKPAYQKVFCNRWEQILPAFTQVRCFHHHLLNHYPLSNEELMEVSIVHRKLLGDSLSDTESFLKQLAEAKGSVTMWDIGLRSEWIQSIPENELYGKVENRRWIAQKWLEEYVSYSQKRLTQQVQAMDALILKKSVASQFGGILKPLSEFEEYGVYLPMR